MFKRLVFIISLFFALQSSWAQQIEIQGNGIAIATDGSNTPALEDGTQYESTPIDASRIHDFVLINNGQENIRILAISSLSSEFRVDSRIRNIRSGQSATLALAFEPTAIGSTQGVILILAREGRTFRVYRFNVSGEAQEITGEADLMISQYYENVNDDYIEVKNLSDYNIRQNAYVLAMFDSEDDLDRAPSAANTIRIGDLDPGEVVTYDNLSFTGNEVFVISSSRGRNCYADRIDVIGIQNVNWGNGISLSKGACATETAHRDFDLSQWIALSTDEVDQALSKQNIYLGTYQEGTLIWVNNSWEGNALPDRTRIVHINDPYDSQNGGIEACDLVVNAELNFDQQSTRSVVVYRDLDMNDSFALGDTESLVMYDDNATINGVITKIEKSTYRNHKYDFTYWSSPTKDAIIKDVFEGVKLSRIFYFDQSKSDISDRNDPNFISGWSRATGAMVNGRGYISEGVTNTIGVHEISFNGVPNNGEIINEIVYHNDADSANDFNLMGNPYPSAIDIEQFFDLNKDVIDPVVYLWTHSTPYSEETGDFSTNDYATYNWTGGTGVGNGPTPEKNIGSAQGFFVRSIDVGDAIFNNSMRIIDSNDQFFKNSSVKKKDKAEEKDRVWIDLKTNKGGFNQILIGFINGASPQYDRGFDAIKNKSSNKISFYSLIDQEKLAIQGLGLLQSSTEVLLGFDTKVSNRTYTISVSAVEGDLRDAEIILRDHHLHIDHDLRNADYSFEEMNQGSYQERFTLVFKRPVHRLIEDELNNDDMLVYNEGDVFTIETTKKVNTIRMYDMRGNTILEKHPRNNSFEVFESLSRRGDVLLMQVIFDDQSEQMKKVYKR